MKCRDGCAASKSGAQVVCDACWARLPGTMRATENCAGCVATATDGRGAPAILRWLSADDKKKER